MKGGCAGTIKSKVNHLPHTPSPEEIDADLCKLAHESPPKQRPWAPWEDQILTKYSGKVRDADLAKKLGRTLSSIGNRRYNLAGVNHE